MRSFLPGFLLEHTHLTRRYFLQCGVAGATALASLPLHAEQPQRDPRLEEVLNELESWLTAQVDFEDVSRGNPKPHSLPEEKKKEVGLTRETWQLEILPDPENPAKIRKPFSKAEGNAFTFADLMKLAEKHAVRYPKVMTCLNLGCPLGNGIWEGVPLREVLWLAEPRENLRRVFYYGYHNDDPKQMFRSSLPVGRVLEDPYDLPPVILCYKLNGEWLSSERGGPVRVIVPEAYGFRSIKWLSHLYLSNMFYANDTYGEKNNDVDSPLKTFCATLSVPKEIKAGEPIPMTGYAQVGISGLQKVQVWIENDNDRIERPKGDRYFSQAPWQDAELLPPPQDWGGSLSENKIPEPTLGFNADTGQPTKWPIRLSKAHWAILHPGLPPGEYTLRCRTIDEKGTAQPMPRPFKKSGRAKIEQVSLKVV